MLMWQDSQNSFSLEAESVQNLGSFFLEVFADGQNDTLKSQEAKRGAAVTGRWWEKCQNLRGDRSWHSDRKT